MCGIAGILALSSQAPVDHDRLVRMRDVLTHRGPDGAGVWIDGPVGLAHRRLSIVDLAGGHQPMSNEDGSVWIVFNGEIYNHAELRRELVRRGHVYRTKSDTETIVHLYEEHGAACVERLQGMFAFALWDGRRRRLLLARDRLGIKPLYWAESHGSLLFGSEVKALLAGGVEPAFEAEVLPEYLANRFVAGARTFFRGVKKLLPGRTLTWSAETGLEERRYWSPPEPRDDDRGSLADRGHELRELLAGTVRGHLMSDVPLGVFLSGGIDSTGIAALAAPEMSGKLRTFSVGYEERAESELDYARATARTLGSDHHEVVVSAADYFGALPLLVWHEDEPLAFTSSVPLYFVSRLARDHVKVVLTGEGADELFLGYNRYRVTAWNTRLGRVWGRLPRGLRRRLGHAALALTGPGARYLRRSFLCLEPGPRDLFCENFAVFPSGLRRRLLWQRPDGGDPYAAALSSWATGHGDVLARMSRADIETYLVELLMKQDQMSMAASVESRVPYLDHLLVEHAVAMPSRFKLHGTMTKAVLRAALRDVVPPAVLRRRKLGFPVPLGGWLRGRFAAFRDELVLGRRARERGLFDPTVLRELCHEHQAGTDHTDRLWLLMGLELWMRIFLDGEDPASVAGAAVAN